MTTTPDPMREALEAADALAEQVHHVALGASVPQMNIHGAASELGPLWRKYHDARAALAAAPQPASNVQKLHIATADQEALMKVIEDATDEYVVVQQKDTIADALLAAGWRRAGQAALDAAKRVAP